MLSALFLLMEWNVVARRNEGNLYQTREKPHKYPEWMGKKVELYGVRKTFSCFSTRKIKRYIFNLKVVVLCYENHTQNYIDVLHYCWLFWQKAHELWKGIKQHSIPRISSSFCCHSQLLVQLPVSIEFLSFTTVIFSSPPQQMTTILRHKGKMSVYVYSVLTCLNLAIASEEMKSPFWSLVKKHITWYWLWPRSSSPSTSAFNTWTSCDNRGKGEREKMY